jgi:hypothetical protein
VGAIHRFEQRLEQMVTGAFARAFRSAVQPLEIAAALQREVDNSAQILSRDRRLAPNDFTIDLSPSDFDRLAEYGETLSRELAAMLHEHAQEQGYVFTGAVMLNFTRADDLTTGRFRVRSAAAAAVHAHGAANVTDTAIRRAAIFLEINGVRHPLAPPGLVVGRGTNADLRIDDPGVSRRHVQFRVQSDPAGTAVTVMDLGSTNGTLVNGQRVQHAVVTDGAVVAIGGTRIFVRAGAEQSGQPPDRGPRPSGNQPSSGQPTPWPDQPGSGQPGPGNAAPGPPPPYWPQSSRSAPPSSAGPHSVEPAPQPAPASWPAPKQKSRRGRKPPFKVVDPPQGGERPPWNG